MHLERGKTPMIIKAYLDRGGKWARANTGVGLHPNGVNGVWGEVTDGGQLVVVHKL